MEQEIIYDYVELKLSIYDICEKYHIGKNKLKNILADNNITLRKKGGQIKYGEKKNKEYETENTQIKCKKCGKIYDDSNNKSGAIITHMSNCYPEVEIPSKYIRKRYGEHNGIPWHFKYFELIEKNTIEYLYCPACNWKSTDLTNKTGSFTKHIEKSHDSISIFLTKYPDYRKYFQKFEFKANYESYIHENDKNRIKCQICGEEFKVLSNSHLKTHNITSDIYKKIYNIKFLASETTKDIFSENLNNCVINNRSNAEIEIEGFLKENNVHVEPSNKKILAGSELDLYIPEYNLAIEYNGLYWHSEKQGRNKFYHIDKTKKCSEKGIQLIHIFSDEWNTKKEIIKKRLLHYLHKDTMSIYARKCEIIKLGKNEKKLFLEENHLQGNDKSNIFLGLKYEDNIVAVMTFGGLRSSLGYKNKEEKTYELYRYASNNVIGGFKKLLKHFICEYKPNKIITYANRNWSSDNKFCFYEKMGFEYIGDTKPNYYYTKDYNKREHRYNFRKDVLVKMGCNPNMSESEIMETMGYDKIWDTGNLKYILQIKKEV